MTLVRVALAQEREVDLSITYDAVVVAVHRNGRRLEQKIGDIRCLPNLQEVLRKAVRQELKDKLIETINVLRARRK